MENSDKFVHFRGKELQLSNSLTLGWTVTSVLFTKLMLVEEQVENLKVSGKVGKRGAIT